MATAGNPHWMGALPAWDVTLSDGTVVKDVTKKEISEQLWKLVRMQKLHPYMAYVTVVTQAHINWFEDGLKFNSINNN